MMNSLRTGYFSYIIPLLFTSMGVTMIERQEITINQPISCLELYKLMKKDWNTKEYNHFTYDKEKDMITLPATKKWIVTIYPFDNLIILNLCQLEEGETFISPDDFLCIYTNYLHQLLIKNQLI